MNCLTFLLIYLVDIRSKGVFYEVQKTIFFENNFWCADQEQLKTDNGYLYRVDVYIGREQDYIGCFHSLSEPFYFLKSTGIGYLVLRNPEIKAKIISFLKLPEVDKFLWKFRFSFTDKPFKNFESSQNCNFKMQGYVTYKLPKRMSDNTISFESDVSTDVLTRHIKERFEVFLLMNPLKFNKYIKNFNEKKLSKVGDDINLNLYHFKTFSDCLNSLEKIIKNLRYFNLLKDSEYEPDDEVIQAIINEFIALNILKDDVSDSSTANESIYKTTLKESRFKEFLYEKFNENLKRLNKNEINENWKQLFEKCSDYLKNEMLQNRIFFPIEDKYDIDYYIDQLSNLIYESAKEEQMKYVVANPEDKDYIFSKIINLLDSDLKKLQLSAVKAVCESKNVLKHFSRFLEKEVETLEDYIKVEKIVCDYYNMFVYMDDLYCKLNKVDSCASYSYFSPISSDNYILRIVYGIGIKLKLPTKSVQIEGFDDKGENVIMLKDTDYFIDGSGILCCPSEVLKVKNIQEIQVMSSDNKKNKKKFKVTKFLNF